MSDSGVLKVLEADKDNVRFSQRELSDRGILDVINYFDVIFGELATEIERSLSASLKLDRDATGLPSSISVRLYFAASARNQFLLAFGHIVRGHITEVFGHVRHAIESAAIGKLIKAEPSVADLFRHQRRREFREQTTTGKILPKEASALTRDLNEMVDTASKRIHNNYESYERRLTESFRVGEWGYHYKNELFIHEISQENLSYFLRVAVWILRAGERVLMLIAESFDIAAGAWHESHSEFASRIERLERDFGKMAD